MVSCGVSLLESSLAGIGNKLAIDALNMLPILLAFACMVDLFSLTWFEMSTLALDFDVLEPTVVPRLLKRRMRQDSCPVRRSWATDGCRGNSTMTSSLENCIKLKRCEDSLGRSVVLDELSLISSDTGTVDEIADVSSSCNLRRNGCWPHFASCGGTGQAHGTGVSA